MEGRRGMNRGMQTMMLMVAMMASMAVVLLWEASPFARSSGRVVVLESPNQSDAEPGRELAKSYDSQPSLRSFPSLENTGADFDDENKTKASNRPERDSSSPEVGEWGGGPIGAASVAIMGDSFRVIQSVQKAAIKTGTGTDVTESETTPDGQSFTDLSQQQDMTGTIVKEEESTVLAEANERSPTDISTTNGTQSTNALEAIAPFESLQRSNAGAESPETTSVAENADMTEKATSKNTSKLTSNSTMQLEEPTDTENNTVKKVVGQGSDSEKQSSIDKSISKDNNQLELRTKSGTEQFSDEIQPQKNVNSSKVTSISSAVEDSKEDELANGKEADLADAEGPDRSIREAAENLGSAIEDDEAGFKSDVVIGAHETEAKVKVCDYTVGKWVLDKTRPLYSGRECKIWLSPDWACRLHNHPDKQMDRYRWQPTGCNLPVFNASAALETLRNKVVAFVGDSLGRQQWQSLLCMLTHGKNTSAISDAASKFNFYTPRGARRPTGWAHRFDATNTTLIFKWTVTLARVEALNKSTNALHLDSPEQFLSDHLHNLDVVILNSGHHWNNGKMQQNGYKFYTKGKPVTSTSVPVAYNKTIHNVINWVHEKTRNSSKVIYYRSLSPRHFRNGDWNTGGTCDNIRFEEGKRAQAGMTVDANAESAVKGTRVRLLNITALSMERGETHVSKYGRDKGGQDCLHWCLPGVPDTWNEILLAELASSFAR